MKTQNYFEIFEIPIAYHIDIKNLETRFYALSRKLHPDRHQFETPENLAQATQKFALVNQAYTTLKSDDQRAQYLLDLADLSQFATKSSLPVDIAEDYFELQENHGEPSKFQVFAGMVKQKIELISQNKERLFSQWEESGAKLEGASKVILEKIKCELNQSAYLTSLTSDLEKRCKT